MRPIGIMFAAAIALGFTSSAHANRDPLVLDLNGDGIDLGGITRTELWGEPLTLRWTRQNTDDAFLVVDATSLRSAGFDLQNERGEPIEGPTLFRDGLRLRDPGGSDHVITDGWQMLGLFDNNQDGRVDSSDPVWQHLKLFTDDNMDGTMDLSELVALEQTIVLAMSTAHGAPYTDSHGSVRRDGSWSGPQGSGGMTGVSLVEFPATDRVPLILDMNRDGIDLGGVVSTELWGEPLTLRWTRQNTDDAFLVVDATSLRSAGFDLQNERGEPIEGPTLFRDGLRLRDPGGSDHVITDGWQMLGLFDNNQDGRVNSSDPVWQHLRLFTDSNMDGTIGPGEVTVLEQSNVLELLTAYGEPYPDSYGNVRRDGSWFGAQAPGFMTGVALAEVTTSVKEPTLSGGARLRAAPNPAMGPVQIDFTLVRESAFELDVLDIAGRKVETLASGTHQAGPHRVLWYGKVRGRTAPAGMYFVRLRAERVFTRSIAVTR